MKKLSGQSPTEQESKLQEKDEQIKEMQKIIGQQKVQTEILKKALVVLTTADKIVIINQLKPEYTITDLCQTFNIFKNTYYYNQSDKTSENKNTADKLYTGHSDCDQNGNLVPEKILLSVFCKIYFIIYSTLIWDIEWLLTI